MPITATSRAKSNVRPPIVVRIGGHAARPRTYASAAMLLAAVVVLAGMAVVLWALYGEPLPEPVAATPTGWGSVLPTPADVGRAAFPTVLRGYDPAAVDAHLDAAARAYADLLAVAPPEVVARARERAATRLGLAAAQRAARPAVAAARWSAHRDEPGAGVASTAGRHHDPDGPRGWRATTRRRRSVLADAQPQPGTTRGLPGDDEDALRSASVLGRLDGNAG